MTEFTTSSLTYIRVHGHSTLILPNSLASHLKLTEISLATFKTKSLIFLLGLTVIYKHFFKLKLLIIFSLVEGEAVAVSARNGTCFSKKDLISPTRPHHFLKGPFSSFFSPINKKTWTLSQNNGGNILPVMQMWKHLLELNVSHYWFWTSI